MNEDIKTLTNRQLLSEIKDSQDHIIVLTSVLSACMNTDTKIESLKRIDDLKIAMIRLHELKEAAENRFASVDIP